MNLFLICIALVSSMKQKLSLFSLKEPKEKTNSKMQIRDMEGYWRQSTGCHQTENPAYIFISPDNTSNNIRWVFVRNNGKIEELASQVQNGKIEVEKHTTNEIVQYWWKRGEKKRRKWTVSNYVKDHSIEWEWELGDNRKGVTISQYDRVSEEDVPQEVQDVLDPKPKTQRFQSRKHEEKQKVIAAPTIDRLRRVQEAQEKTDSLRGTSTRSGSPTTFSSISSVSSSSRLLVDSPSISTSSTLTSHPSSDAISSITILPDSSPSTVRNKEAAPSPTKKTKERNRNLNTRKMRYLFELNKRKEEKKEYEEEQKNKKDQEKKAREEEEEKKKEAQIQANLDKKIAKQLKKEKAVLEAQRLQKQFGLL